MKKVMIVVAVATFAFSACSENKKENAAAGHQENESTAAAGKVVVEAPDYSASGEAVKPGVEQILAGYLELKEALIGADAPGAKAHAQAILAATAQVEVSTLP